jgi:hypothetical protein
MTALNIAVTVTSYFTIVILIYFIRREKARISRKALVISAIVAGAVFAAVYPFWEMRFGQTIQAVDLYILLEFILIAPPAFIIYPKKPNKNLFFISTTTPLLVVGHGLGNLSEITIAPGELVGRILNLLIMIVCFAVIVAGVFWLTRIKFPGLYESQNPKLWRRLFIITILMGLTQIVAGNVFSGSTFNAAGIIPARLICLAGMAAILFIAGLAKRQAEEATEVSVRAQAAEEAAKAKSDAYAEIVAQTEETDRLRHDKRQVFAAIGGLNEPGKEKELESYCLEVLAQLNGKTGDTA